MSMRMIAALALLALIGVEAQAVKDAYPKNWRSLRNGAPLKCGICGSGGDQSKDVDYLANPFSSSTGKKWTCDYLQQTVQDVDPAGAGAEGILCGSARCGQAHECCAEKNSLCTDFTDINEECDICAGRGLNPSKSGDTVQTYAGNLNCKGLVDFALIGGVSRTKCLDLSRTAAQCCLAGGNNGGGNTASTKQPTKRPTNQATQPTKRPTRNPFAPTPRAKRGKNKSISGGYGGAAGRNKRALDDKEPTTSGSVGISSGLMGILVALVGLCIAR